MKNRIMNKLRSKAGASITFALLLFLVCAVLCSVIIVAASAAAGRITRLSQSEQNYYAVTSAAELLKQLIDKKTVSLVTVVTTTYDTPYTDGSPGAESTVSTATNYYLIPEERPGDIIINHSFVAGGSDDAFLVSATTNDSIPVDAAINIYNSNFFTTRGLEFDSSFYAAEGFDYDAIAVTINEKLDSDGKITLTLYNKYKNSTTLNDATSGFTMLLEFGADEIQTSSTRTEDISTTTTGASSFTVRSEKTEITIRNFTWHLTSSRSSL